VSRIRRQTSRPVDRGHEHVEQHRVGRCGRLTADRLAAVGGEVDVIAVAAQHPLERLAHRGLVVDHQHPHAAIVASEAERDVNARSVRLPVPAAVRRTPGTLPRRSR
jgi:hypothetical protein